MEKEIVTTGKSVELALADALEQLGTTEDQVTYEVLEEPKKGLFGIGATDAKIRVTRNESPLTRAVDFLETLLSHMQPDASVQVVSAEADSIEIDLVGGHLGSLIGRRGDVLDSIQYLTTLAANLGNSGYCRITVDAQGYRAKRAETVANIGRRMAEKVIKYHRSFALDPMTAYERRIVHAAIQEIPGVTSHSVGEGADRHVVVSPDKGQ